MSAILDAGDTGMPVAISEAVERPPALEEADAARLFAA